jgi:hypothetical protein
MNKFRTEIKVTPTAATMNLKTQVITQGSCFADAIGERLHAFKVNSMVNPFGVIYNPESIHKVLEYAIFNEGLPAHTYLSHNDVFLNYNFHSEFSALRKDELVTRLLNTIGTTHYFLKNTDWIIVTYGTAWVYRRKDTGEVVANCHKMPAATFAKSLMTPEEVMSSFRNFYGSLKKFNPTARIILTVSPVRHIKDSLVLNNVSKAVLLMACHSITGAFDDVEYFPAYEMMIDDLRDYRFYKEDMLHPTMQAEDYIWEKFMERYFSIELRAFVEKWGRILSALKHKPFHPESAAHQQFLRDTLEKLDELKSLVNVEQETAAMKMQII